MKKLTTLSLTIILGVAFMLTPSMASNCGAGLKVGKADAAAAESAVKTAKSDEVKEATKAAKAADDGLSLVTLNVTGMTCGGCEAHVGKTLKACVGVSEVVEVSHKDNKAVVKYDPSKIEADKLASTITKLGYKAEVQPAVAKTTKEAVETEEKKATKDM